MKIILENELEKWAWGVMMAAHYKWEKNHGGSLQDLMSWYFEDLYKEETEKALKDEIECRFRRAWGDDSRLTEEEYVAKGLEEGLEICGDDWDDDEKKDYENELREDFKFLQEDIAYEREGLEFDVKKELRSLYYTFFNAPEDLTVIYKDEIIQGKKDK
ncbi:MAG: hypothetical protein A4E56_01438 [Pelotomaculum sp. PtaU1.Bin065]|nr:MAG: hypothetical protein A4E56_01438 [Pelotomaculum sp. PtaU1.Bin065]